MRRVCVLARMPIPDGMGTSHASLLLSACCCSPLLLLLLFLSFIFILIFKSLRVLGHQL